MGTKIYFATSPTDHIQHEALNKFGAKHILFSYFYAQGWREGALADLIENGSMRYKEKPDEPIEEVPLDVELICGGWWNDDNE